jgi:phosphoribosylaminoimidazole carboxylase PurE protein
MAKENFKVAIIMGSDSDWEIMERCYQQLQQFGISTDVQVRSAHRTPEAVTAYVRQAENDGVRVFIAAAGMAAALPGVVAAHTTRPVVGVPLVAGALAGVDALLSIVQMPPGIPVATVSIGPAGAQNAALLAAQILAQVDPGLEATLKNFKSSQAESVDKTCQSLRERVGLV